MLNIFKMDMHRIFRSKTYYICLMSMCLVAGTMIILGVIPDFSTVMGSDVVDMTESMMGIGMVFMIISVFFTLYICQEFTSGFAKNIFARHANPIHYIGGKLLSLTASAAIILIVFTLMSMILLIISGVGVLLLGGILGLVTFLVGKILACMTLASLILLVCIVTRKPVVGIIAGVITAMGVIPMILGIAGNMFGLTWVSGIMNYTISGLSSLANLTFNAPIFFIILIGSLIWTAALAILGSRAINRKDI